MLKSPSSDPRIGTLFGNFRIVRKLGEGGMGIVYEAENPKIQSRAAVKILHAHACARHRASLLSVLTFLLRVAYIGAKFGSATMTSIPIDSKCRATHSLGVLDSSRTLAPL